MHNHLLFLSDMVTADGHNIEDRFLSALRNPDLHSPYNFPTEHPSADYWATWRTFWKNYCGPSLSVPTPLGQWVCTTHRRWKWYYDKDEGILQQCAGDTIWIY